MIPGAVVIAISAGYLLVLFAVAAFAERRAAGGRSVIGTSLVYALSLGVYCSAWTYFGSIGRAASTGVWFLPIYLGPMLAMILATLVVRKMIRIARTYRTTSIADFIASRYGKSPLIAALVTLITVVGIVPYIALQLKAVATAFTLLTDGPGTAPASGGALWGDSALLVTLALAAFTILFGTRHLDSAERHEGMVAAIAVESLVKLGAFLAVGIFVTWGLFDGLGDIWARAQALPGVARLFVLDEVGGGARFAPAQWFALVLLSGLSVLLLPRQFQMMVVECVDERHVARAAWVFPLYLLAINLFVLPLALGGLVLFGPGGMNPETFVLSLPLTQGAPGLALVAYLGGLSAATGMLIVETVAISTMVCNDLVMPALLRLTPAAIHSGGDLTRLLLNIRRAAILAILLLGFLYFRVAGDAYALVSIGLISFAAVAQFAPALLIGMFWRGGTAAGAIGGLTGGFLVWIYMLMLPSVAKSGWIPGGFVRDGPFGIALLKPEAFLGLTGFDALTHALFWSLVVNVGLYLVLSLARSPGGREASQALLFVDVFDRPTGDDAPAPVFWRGRVRTGDLAALAARLLGPARADMLMADHARETGIGAIPDRTADARLVDRVEREIAGAVGSASARVLVASVAEEEALDLEDVIEILAEASQLRVYARALEEKSLSLERATAELTAANAQLKTLDQMKDDFMSSVTHELRTPLTSIRALSELMRDMPDMEEEQRAEFLRIIVSESERLGRLVNQVLDMAKIESGHAEWTLGEVDLGAVIRDAAIAAGELIRGRGAALTLDLPERVPLLHADRDRLTQVITNLLSNAAKFVPSAGGRVDVRLRQEENDLVVEIADNGPGVAPEDRETIFEKFRQGGGANGRPPGTGLGLPISREIVEHFGGRLELGTHAGTSGACFRVRLPVRAGGQKDP